VPSDSANKNHITVSIPSATSISFNYENAKVENTVENFEDTNIQNFSFKKKQLSYNGNLPYTGLNLDYYNSVNR